MGRPEREIPCIVHVGGTNGKGSVTAMAAAMFRAAGFRTAMFVSPSPEGERGMLRLDGAPIPAPVFRRHAWKVRRACARIPSEVGRPTRFEFLTGLLYVWCVHAGVDVLVQEVGMGGRYDATNAAARIDLTVLTNVTLEHQRWLGATPAAIASEKAEIIRPGVPVLTAATGETLQVISETARNRGAPLIRLTADSPRTAGFLPKTGDGNWILSEIRTDLDGTSWSLRGRFPGFGRRVDVSGRYRTPLRGEHQAWNGSLAVGAVALAAQRCFGVRLSPQDLQKGLATCRWPGRLDIWRGRPTLLLDGAHNPAGMASLREALTKLFPGTIPVLVIGMLADKDALGVAEVWAGRTLPVVTVPVPHPRSRSPAELAACFRRVGFSQVEVRPSWQAGLRRATGWATSGGFTASAAGGSTGSAVGDASTQKGGLVVVCGSLYLIEAVSRQSERWQAEIS